MSERLTDEELADVANCVGDGRCHACRDLPGDRVTCSVCFGFGMFNLSTKTMESALTELVERRLAEKNGTASDGYHTFNELYDHRITLYITLCRIFYLVSSFIPQRQTSVWRSKIHSDGTSIEGWFVLGIGDKPGEQITYHLPLARWNETDGIVELERSPPDFDGHTSADVLVRLRNLWPF